MDHPILESIILAARAYDPALDEPWATNIGGKARAYHIVEEWHRDHHVGRYDHCDQQPCHAIIRAVWVR